MSASWRTLVSVSIVTGVVWPSTVPVNTMASRFILAAKGIHRLGTIRKVMIHNPIVSAASDRMRRRLRFSAAAASAFASIAAGRPRSVSCGSNLFGLMRIPFHQAAQRSLGVVDSRPDGAQLATDGRRDLLVAH